MYGSVKGIPGGRTFGVFASGFHSLNAGMSGWNAFLSLGEVSEVSSTTAYGGIAGFGGQFGPAGFQASVTVMS